MKQLYFISIGFLIDIQMVLECVQSRDLCWVWLPKLFASNSNLTVIKLFFFSFKHLKTFYVPQWLEIALSLRALEDLCFLTCCLGIVIFRLSPNAAVLKWAESDSSLHSRWSECTGHSTCNSLCSYCVLKGKLKNCPYAPPSLLFYCQWGLMQGKWKKFQRWWCKMFSLCYTLILSHLQF